LLLGERVDTQRKLSLGGALLGAFSFGWLWHLRANTDHHRLAAVLSGFALAMNNVWFRKLEHVSVADKTAAVFTGC
jgi:hypothetical protein